MTSKNICRVCLFKPEDVQTCTLFKHCAFSKMTYADMLCFITNIKVTVNDGLPDKMCQSCCGDLEKAYSFTMLAKDSDTKLRESGNIKKKLSFDSITDIKKELKDLSVKKEKTKLVFNSISDIKCKLEDLNVKKEKTWDIEVVDVNVPNERGKTSTIANTTIKKVKTENKVPICNIEISDDDDDRDNNDDDRDNDDDVRENASDDIFFKDNKKDDPDYCPSEEEEAPPKQKLQPKATIIKKTKVAYNKKLKAADIPMKLKIGNACIITNSNPNMKIRKIISTNGAVSIRRLNKAKPPVNGKPKVSNNKQSVAVKIINAARVITKKIAINNEMPVKEKSMCPSCGLLTHFLDQHMLTHKEKEFKCQMCDKEYHTQCQLDTHMRHHTGEKTFMCDECGKGYFNKRTLDSHILAIHKDKALICTICPKKFSNKSTLRNHMDTHEGIKRHNCTVCGMAFRRQHHIKAHMVTHTGERSYSCEVCGVAFRRPHHVKAHMITHTGKRSYSCEVCNTDFPYKVNLNSHVLRDHNIDIKGRQLTKFTRDLLRHEIDKLEQALANEMQSMNKDNDNLGSEPTLSAFQPL